MKYSVKSMRVVFPTGKTAEKRPDLFAVVHGEYFDPKGQKLSISRKEITIEMAKATDFALDIEKGILAIPSGKRGRKAMPSATPAEIAQRLKSLKG